MNRFAIFAVSVACNYVALVLAEKVVDRYLEKHPYAGLKLVPDAKKAA